VVACARGGGGVGRHKQEEAPSASSFEEAVVENGGGLSGGHGGGGRSIEKQSTAEDWGFLGLQNQAAAGFIRLASVIRHALSTKGER